MMLRTVMKQRRQASMAGLDPSIVAVSGVTRGHRGVTRGSPGVTGGHQGVTRGASPHHGSVALTGGWQSVAVVGWIVTPVSVSIDLT